jgi:hypothetical protein
MNEESGIGNYPTRRILRLSESTRKVWHGQGRMRIPPLHSLHSGSLPGRSGSDGRCNSTSSAIRPHRSSASSPSEIACRWRLLSSKMI